MVNFSPHDLVSNISHVPFVSSASSWYGANPPFMAFDAGAGNSEWIGIEYFGTYWLQLDCGAGFQGILSTYNIVNGSLASRAPKDWTILGSNDNISWNVLDTVAGEVGWAAGEIRTYIVDVTTSAYRYFQLSITANNGDITYVNIKELYLNGTVLSGTSPGSLSLQCVCLGTNNCVLTKLVYKLHISHQNVNGGTFVGATGHFFTLSSNPTEIGAPYILENGSSIENPPYGSSDLSFNLTPLSDWTSRWATISLKLDIYASVNQIPDILGLSYDKWTGFGYIEQHYICTDSVTGVVTTKVLVATATNGSGTSDPSYNRASCTGAGGVTGTLYMSTSLGGGGCSAIVNNFEPVANTTETITITKDSPVCLCAINGIGPYIFSILIGNLPSGQILDVDTGCIVGVPDGVSQGSSTITFQVIDLGVLTGANTATVICSGPASKSDFLLKGINIYGKEVYAMRPALTQNK